jgi:hypothetical protein
MLAEVALEGEYSNCHLCGLPATLGEAVRCRKVGHVDADHGLAEPA